MHERERTGDKMKVLMINGSRREKGCTYTALTEIGKVLSEEKIDSEILYIGKRAVNGEIDELVREAAEKAMEADALIVGSPVYYASPSGEVLSFLDRFFQLGGAVLKHKPGAAVTSARRAGTTASLDVLNKYFLINEMPLVSSCYWPMVHGNSPEEVRKDEEGIFVMRTLARNLSWLLRLIELGRKEGVTAPESGPKPKTNFIRFEP